MKKVFHYLKPYTLWVLVCLLLLFGQAMSDLSLPNLMSDIVNVGIQQAGIVEQSPKAISADAYTLMRTFLNDSDQQTLDAAYTKVVADSAEAKALAKDYPAAVTTDIYQRTGGTDDELGALFGKATITMMNYFKEMAAQNGQTASSSDSASVTEGIKDIDWTKLYAMQPMLNQLPAAAFDSARDKAKALDESLLSQISTAMITSFYQELDVDTGAIRMAYIIQKGIAMLLLALAGAVAAILVGLLSARIAAGVSRTMRRDVFHRVESFSSTEFDRFSTASLITRTTNDITQVQVLLIMGIRMICYAPIMGLGGAIMALRKSPSMSWIIVLGVLVMICLILTVFLVAMPRFKIVQRLIDRINLVTREQLSGVPVIRAFGTERFEEKRFDKANGELTDVNLFISRTMATMMPLMGFIMNSISLLIVWVGAHQVETAAIQVGDMLAFLQYAMQIIVAFLMMSIMFILVPRAAVSANRVAEVLNTKPDITDPEQPKTWGGRPRGRVEFRNVNFRYDKAEDDVLHDITFTAEPGQTTAFIGSTGSGKSTLVHLIPRFYDVTGGSITVDGVDVRDLTQHDLREIIGFVPQKGVLFSGDIASNLRYGRRDATDDDIDTAAEVAQATEFISGLDEGMRHAIAQGGTNVSGGQKQRLAIARALIKKSPIYIFDDSFSALDFKTDAALRRALKQHTGESAVLIVAQRVSTIMHAEKIVVLDEGRIVGIGTHQELLNTCETYREIASSQLTKEELA